MLEAYRRILCIDFEFYQPDGEQPVPRVMVVRDARTDEEHRYWVDDFGDRPPFDVGKDTLFVAWFASAELNCFHVLNWPIPANILDLFVEFRRHTNGLVLKHGASLNGALMYYGFPSINAKEEMRQLAMRESGQYTEQEKRALLDYCAADVRALVKILQVMLKSNHLDIARSVRIRGRYMKAVSAMEMCGVPIDIDILQILRERWQSIQQQLIDEFNPEYGIYEGSTFKDHLFERYLIENRIPWPRLDSGKLCKKADTFKQMAKVNAKIAPIHELRVTLSSLRLESLAVGSDGRNRCLLSPFGAKTSRNTPSNTKFIFGPATWIRGLIKPRSGYALVNIDWSQQEFAIAAALSGDDNMMAAYLSGDPYLHFAKLAGAVPEDGDSITHASEREIFKACVLGLQYGMGPVTLAYRIGDVKAKGRELILQHKEAFPRFWKYSEAAIHRALVDCEIHSVFDWRLKIAITPKYESLRNWPVQTNAAEMMRIAAILLTEHGLRVCAPVHDAFLIEVHQEDFIEQINLAQALMQKAGEIVLAGFPLRSEVHSIFYPDRYMDKRGKKMWDRIMKLANIDPDRKITNGICPISSLDRNHIPEHRPV